MKWVIFSDHRAIKVVLEVPVLPVKKNNKKEERINFRNAEGWNTYAEVSDKQAGAELGQAQIKLDLGFPLIKTL